ncbi:MAG: Ca-activated chloride channel [Acidobacteriota bacterium]|jgi:VWFA-related protein|nr:Ca-activated chloride channel [Acidobacteriota bacterium]MDT7809008.1 Ca-activated chloride channel [Acidobacteriota bacterium]
MKRLALALLLLPLAFSFPTTSTPQSRPRVVRSKDEAVVRGDEEVVKTDIDLVVLDALVLQKKTGRVVGGLKREDFTLTEDGVAQQITQFSQNSLPLSVLLLIDRGGCLDPFGENVRRAARDAISHLKPSDEVAVMAYHDSVDLVEEFTRDRQAVSDALDRVPGHDEEANHCLNRAFYEAARYMVSAGNPVGRRVIIVITGVTSNFDCQGGPSGAEARREVFESGSVVCGLIPRSPEQKMESGMMRTATSIGNIFKVPSLRINDLAEETGGEVLDDKPENLDRTFDTLIEHLRTRYQMAFVPTNRKHDGTTRKLRVKVSPSVERAQGKLAVKTRRSYIAPKG